MAKRKKSEIDEMVDRLKDLERKIEVVKKYYIPHIRNILLSLEVLCDSCEEIKNLKTNTKTIH